MRRFLIVAIALLLPVVLGCDDDGGPTGPSGLPVVQPTSANEAVDLVREALVSRHVEQYDSVLARDFRFVFNPLDVEDAELNVPASWGLSSELETVGNMLASPDVEEIKLDFLPGPVVASDVPGADSSLTVSNIFLEVTIRLPSGEPLFAQAEGQFTLHVREMPWMTGAGEPVWKIVQWDDLTLRPGPYAGLTQQTTWGTMKGTFRAPPPAGRPSTPEAAAGLTAVALEARDIASYDSLLTRDFEFFFNPEDAANDTLDIPESWGIEDELRAVGNLLAAPEVEDVKFQWTVNAAEPSDVAEIADRRILTSDVFIEVTTRLPSGEPLFTQAEGMFRIYLRKMSWDDGHGYPAWKISRWEDRTARQGPFPGATEQTTWGQIKSIYR